MTDRIQNFYPTRFTVQFPVESWVVKTILFAPHSGQASITSSLSESFSMILFVLTISQKEILQLAQYFVTLFFPSHFLQIIVYINSQYVTIKPISNQVVINNLIQNNMLASNKKGIVTNSAIYLRGKRGGLEQNLYS